MVQVGTQEFLIGCNSKKKKMFLQWTFAEDKTGYHLSSLLAMLQWCCGRRLSALRATESTVFETSSDNGSNGAADEDDHVDGRGLAESPFDASSCAAFCDFSFVEPLLRRGVEAPIRAHDLDALAEHDRVALLVDELHRNWTIELKAHAQRATDGGSAARALCCGMCCERCAAGRKPSFWRALYRSHTCVFYYSAFWTLGESVCRIIQPVILGSFIGWLVDPNTLRLSKTWQWKLAPEVAGSRSVGRYSLGAMWVVLLLLAALSQIAVHHQMYFYTMRAGWNIRLATTGLIHRKLLTLSAAALSGPGSDVAQIVNLASSDVNRFDRFIPSLHFAWSGPFDLVVIFGLLASEVGPLAAVAAVAIVVLLIPIQLILGRRFGKQRRVTVDLTDKRMRVVKEVFSSIEAVKTFCWEDEFGAKVGAIRKRERASICISQVRVNLGDGLRLPARGPIPVAGPQYKNKILTIVLLSSLCSFYSLHPFRCHLIPQALKSFNLAAYFATPYLSTFATFTLMWALGETLEVTEVFATIALIHVLRIGMGKNLTRVLEAGPECAISVQRIRNFLLLPSTFDDVYAATAAAGAGVAAPAVAAPAETDTASGHTGGDANCVLRLEACDFSWREHNGVGGGGDTSGGGAASSSSSSSSSSSESERNDDERGAAASSSSAALTGISFSVKRGEFLLFTVTFCSSPAHQHLTLSRPLPSLTGINAGEMVVLWGPTGCGKSTLLASVLGELECTSGTMAKGGPGRGGAAESGAVGGAVAVSMQQAWVMAGSVRSNICFGKRFEKLWYAKVTRACALETDFAQLPRGDLTYIGDNGVNLSGGQRARVSLARAVYARPILALLDDTLSAVDPVVGRRLLRECIVELLLKECRSAVLLATHHIGELILFTVTF